MLLAATSQPAAGPAGVAGHGGSESCAVEERDCSTPLCLSQSAAGIRGTEDVPPMRVPDPDPKLTNTFQATEGWELVHSEASQCHQRG